MSNSALKKVSVDELVKELDRRGYDVEIYKCEKFPELPEGWQYMCCENCSHYDEDCHYCGKWGGKMSADSCCDEDFADWSGRNPEEDRTVVYVQDKDGQQVYAVFPEQPFDNPADLAMEYVKLYQTFPKMKLYRPDENGDRKGICVAWPL